MKFITKLNETQVIELVSNGKLSNVCIIPITSRLCSLVRDYLENNTGFPNPPVMGLTRVLGSDDIDECSNDLSNLISLQQGDYLLEFDMPSDMIATIDYEDFLNLSGNPRVSSDDINDRLKIEGHSDTENEMAFTSVLIFKYCKGYLLVGPDWGSEACTLRSPEDFKQLNYFNRKEGN